MLSRFVLSTPELGFAANLRLPSSDARRWPRPAATASFGAGRTAPTGRERSSVSKDLTAWLASAARAMQAEPGVQYTLDRAVGLAVDLIGGCDHAGVSLVHRSGAVEFPVATDGTFSKLEQMEHDLGEGPCLDAMWTTDTVVSPDLAAESRWPTWASRATSEFGVASMLGFQLFINGETLGSLNLYSQQANGFDTDAIATGSGLAAHVAVALAASQAREQFDSALSTRTMIGQAEGVLMERFGITGDQAFAVLRRVSQDTNTKLRDVARHLLDTGQTPST